MADLGPYLAHVLVLGIGIGAGATGKLGLSALSKFLSNGRRGSNQEQQVNVEIGKTETAAGSCVECVRKLADLLPCKSHGELVAKLEFAEKQDTAMATWIRSVEVKIDEIHAGQTAMMMAMVEKGFRIQVPKRG